MTSDERAKRIEEAARELLRETDLVPWPWSGRRVGLEMALALVPYPPPDRCFRCGDAEVPGYLLLSGKGNALIPCPYCNPGKAVEWMVDAVVEPAPPREPVEALFGGVIYQPAPPPAPSEECAVHHYRWQSSPGPCRNCGKGPVLWHDGLGSTTTDEHHKCAACGMEGYADGIDS